MRFLLKKSNLPPISKKSATTKNPVMDFKQIQELIKIVNKSNIGELQIEENDFKITIKQKKDQVIQMMGAQMQQAPMQVQSLPQPNTTPAISNKKEEKSNFIFARLLNFVVFCCKILVIVQLIATNI